MDALQRYIAARDAMVTCEDQLKILANEHDLTVSEFMILIMVGRGFRRSGPLAKVTGYNPSTVSHTISDLEDRNLLKRSRGEGDARAFELVLTKAGIAIAKSMEEEF